MIIWDKAPMAHKYCFEALDKTLNDIMGMLISTVFHLMEKLLYLEAILGKFFPSYLEEVDQT